MDELAKIIAGVSPYAAVFLILGKSTIEVIHDYLRVSAWKQDWILKRIGNIERYLKIDTPDPDEPIPATKVGLR